MQPRIAICGYLKPTLAESLAVASEADAHRALDVSLAPLDPVSTLDELRALAEREIVHARHHFPIGPVDIGAPIPAAADAALETMAAAVRGISELGGDTLTVHLPLHDDERGTRRMVEAVARLKALVEYGAEHGVRVCVENLRWGVSADPLEFAGIVERTGAWVTFDVGHALSSRWSHRGHAAALFARTMAPRMLNAHVYEREDTRHHPPGDLRIIRPVLDELRDAGCDWWVIELLDESEMRSTRALLNAYVAEARLSPCATTLPAVAQ